MTVAAECDRDEWLEAARTSAGSTFFHTPMWATLIEQARLPARGSAQVLRAGDGSRLILPMATYRTRFVPVTHCLSTAEGCYGGPLSPRPLTSDDLQTVLEALRRGGSSAVLTENPYGPFPADCAPLDPAWTRENDFTDVLALADDADGVLATFAKQRRYEIRKGRRSGVTVRDGVSQKDYADYGALYAASLARWADRATSRHTAALFDACREVGHSAPGHIRLWLAERDSEPLAGAIVFYWKQTASYWHGASSSAGHSVHATSVLLADVIADCCHRGLSWFDFNPSSGHEGVAAFKRQFGTERWPLRRFIWTTATARGLSAVRARLRR